MDEGREEMLAADLSGPGLRVCVAKGGVGGRGNAAFASPTNRFPLLAEAGEPGEEHRVRLSLKLVAEVGIIGVPNAGKSTLLAAVTAARPKIADYPFTTVEPTLGVVLHGSRDFVMADIPGLLEGAHRGVGLGHDFLRHVERTRVLVHVLDGSSQDPVTDFHRISDELRLYNESLAGRPQVVALNKIDIPEVSQRADEIVTRLSSEGEQVHLLSAAGRVGVDDLLDVVIEVLDREPAERGDFIGESPRGPVAVVRPRPRAEAVGVRQEEGTYVVESGAERIAAMVDGTDWESRMQFYRHLKRVGVAKALEKAGVKPGDRVRVGRLEFEWE